MFWVEFNKTDFNRLMRAINRVETVSKQRIEDDMQRVCALDYKQQIALNILSQKYAFKPYSKKYKAWKQQNFPWFPAYWRLYGKLLKSLSAFRYSGGWMGGVPSSARGQHGERVATYGSYVEDGFTAKGGSVRPPRKLFRKTYDEYKNRNNPGPKSWHGRGNQSLIVIGNAWR